MFARRGDQRLAAPATVAESVASLIQAAGQPALFAHSEFVKEANCMRCGAPKRPPAETAYLCCDNCGALVDYDYRLASLGTNAEVSNTVFHQLVAPVQAQLEFARSTGNVGLYRQPPAPCPISASGSRRWGALPTRCRSLRRRSPRCLPSRPVPFGAPR